MAEINNILSNTLLSGTSGDDKIHNGKWSSHVGSNVKIDGRSGNDFIDNYGKNVTIMGGNGNDSIINYGYYTEKRRNNVTIIGGNGNDSIVNGTNSENSSISVDDGDDYVENYSNKVTISGGKGNDTILNHYHFKNDDDDYDENLGNNVVFKYDSGDGNDIIYGFNETSRLSIIGGSYSSMTSGDDIIVTVGEGKITLVGAASLSAVNIIGEETPIETNSWTLDGTTAKYGTSAKTLVTVKGVKSVDGLKVDNKVVTVSNSSLNAKKVTISGDGYTLKLGDDVPAPKTKKAAFSLSGSTATYKSSYKTAGYKLASDGKSISYSKATTAETLALIQGAKSTKGLSVSGNTITLKNSALSKNVTVSGAYEFNFASDYKKATIIGSSSADSITNYGSNNLINTGASAANSILNHGFKVTISTGNGDDTIKNYYKGYSDGTYKDTVSDYYEDYPNLVSINTGKGNDYVDNQGNECTINTGSGNDSVYNFNGYYCKINTGAGNDYVYNHFDCSNATINTGEGNDLISLESYSYQNVLIEYTSGDGNDTIYGFDGDDTLSINGGKYSTTKSGKNIIVTVGEGKITLIGAASFGSSLNIAGTEKVTTPATLLTVNNSTNSPVTVGSAVKVINASSRTKAVKITGNKLANSISGGSKNDSLYGGAGNDSIFGNVGNDILYGEAGNDTLNGGKGNDSLTGGKGADIFVYSAGNDFITDYAEEDKISITSGKVSTIKTSGNNVIFTVGSGKITVKGGKDKTITYSDSSGKNKKYKYEEPSDDETVTLPKTYSKENYTMGDGVFTLDASKVRLDLKIVGNKFANSIIGGDQNDTLIGGKANDTLFGGEGMDVFVWNKGDGNDKILDYAEEDIVSIKGDTVKSFSASSDDIILTLASKSKITIAGGKDKLITYVDDKGEHIYPKIFTTKGKAIALTDEYLKKDFNVSDYGNYKTINASAVEHSLNIVGNELANSIFGTADDDTIDGAAGKDILRGGAGNDSLIGGAGNDTIYGGEGSDTLWGGKGNDYLYGNDGEDVFIYKPGEGIDRIFGYNPQYDTIKLLSGKVDNAEAAGTDVVFTIENGKIILDNAAGQYAKIVNSSGKTLKEYFPKTKS